MRIAIAFAVFAVLGSTALAWWMLEKDQRDSRELFQRLAETNTRFVRDSGLPRSEKLAANLSEILKMNVSFRPVSIEAEDGVRALPGGKEMIATKLDDRWDIHFERNSEGVGARFLQKSTLVPIGLFCVSCLALGLAISQNLVRPLAELARHIPNLDTNDSLPALDRADEIGHLARTFDRTRRELAEERSRREQSEKLAILGRMATGLAHEIRNPVAAIRMHAQIANSELIVSESEKIEGLVNQWMFLARPEPPKCSVQDLRDRVETVLASMAPAAAHAGVVFEKDMAEPMMVSIDGQRMEQVIRNIVINAIHAMPSGGKLTVSGRGSSLMFKDEGGGFSEEALARHGEMFFSTKEGGMGIGLTVAEEITRAHGGELRVRNDGGAVVEIYLPA
jgi:signal transduction histidine kinase